MNYFSIVAALFSRPGISPKAALAAAVATTAKELVEHRVRLQAPAFFEPDLTSGICVVNSASLGGSRLLGAVENHYRFTPPFMPRAIRNVGSLVLWELDTTTKGATARKVQDQAQELCQTTFDSSLPGQTEAALLVVHPEVLEGSTPLLSKLLARSVIVSEDQDPSVGTVRDLESASRVLASLRRVIKEAPAFRFDSEAVDLLQNFPLGDSPEQRHHRVKIAKLSGLFFAGRRVLDGGSELITGSDVLAARDMVFAGEGCGCEPLPPEDAEIREQEDTLFERMMRTWKTAGQTEVPMSIVQTTLRRSRRPGALRVPDLLLGLSRRGKIKITCQPRSGCGTGGRPKKVIVLPPIAIALPPPTILALPAASDPNPMPLSTTA
jgi:hypothetical protein